MARDYAGSRNGNGRKNGNRKSGGGGGAPGWMWMLVGLTLGLLVATAIYIHKPVPRHGAAPEPELAPKAQVPEEAPAEEAAPKKPETQVDRDSRFDFYEMLPNYEVVVPKEEYAREEDKPALKGPGQYVIQAGSFRTFTDADRLKASMALLGIESHIEKITAGDNAQTWFRVRVGPEKKLDVINEQLRLLRENKIEGILIRINPKG
jgi:cell division protein FtsN